MGDLISRSALIDFINEKDKGREYTIFHFIEWVNNQPTAYDVDKVVEKLEDYSLEFGITATQYEEDGWYNHAKKQREYMKIIDKVIEIVKSGGTNLD